MKYTLTEVDLPYLRAILEKSGVDKESCAALLRSVEVVTEDEVAATEHVEVDLGGQDHASYLAKIACDLISGMQAPPGGSPSSPVGRGKGAAAKAGGDGEIRPRGGHPQHNALPDPGTDGSGGGAGGASWGGSSTEIGVEIWKGAKELYKSWNEGGKNPPGKQKVIHHPGKQWLDPGWYERR